MERDTLILQQPHGAHGARVGAAPAAGAPLGVVQVGRTVDAEPHARSRATEEASPILVHQQSVGLEGVGEAQARRAARGNERGRLLVPGERNGQRLAAVPRHLQLTREERALEYAPANEV